jgi:hypothetical protein
MAGVRIPNTPTFRDSLILCPDCAFVFTWEYLEESTQHFRLCHRRFEKSGGRSRIRQAFVYRNITLVSDGVRK